MSRRTSANTPSKLSTENLFLLEFLVDDLQLDSRCDCMNPGGVCVCFQFLDNEPLDVCEEDFNGGNKFGEEAVKTGKSCLFSLTPQQLQQVLMSFDVTVGVFKKMPVGSQPEKACVGSAKVSVLNMFMDLIKSDEAATCAKVLQETHPLLDDNNASVGKIGVYIRLSCYGKTIVTQFQMNMDDKSVLFKDKDGHSLYRYKKSKKGGRSTKIEDMSCKESSLQPPCPCPEPPQQMYQQPMGYGQQYPPSNPNCPQQPCFPPNGGPGMGGPSMMGLGMGGPGMMGPGMGGPGMGGPGMMGPGMGGPGMMGPGMGGPGMMGPGMGGPGMMGPGMMGGGGMFPPPNPNCPNQPCFPSNMGMQDDCPSVPCKPSQQVSFAKRAGSGCGGGCGRA